MATSSFNLFIQHLAVAALIATTSGTSMAAPSSRDPAASLYAKRSALSEGKSANVNADYLTVEAKRRAKLSARRAAASDKAAQASGSGTAGLSGNGDTNIGSVIVQPGGKIIANELVIYVTTGDVTTIGKNGP